MKGLVSWRRAGSMSPAGAVARGLRKQPGFPEFRPSNHTQLSTSSSRISSSSTVVPATAESGYMLAPQPLPNPFTSDRSLQRVLAWYLPSEIMEKVVSHLTRFGKEAVSEETNQWIANAEKQQPYIKTHDVWGKRYGYDKLVTTLGWNELGRWGARNGVVALGYEPQFGDYRRIVQHATNYIFSASSAVYSCPTSMTSGAARLLSIQVPNLPSSHPFHETLRRLISRTDDRWVSSQWMTERPGGSDVQNSETVATYSPLPSKTGSEFGTIAEGDYLISGFKYFSSATDAHIAFILAKTASGKLSLFLAPLRKTIVHSDGKETEVTNGVRIHRLKTKMGTKELPTAELELKDTRAHLVGELDRGIPTVANLLNVSRSHNFITSASMWRRAMAMAKSFARARTTIDQPLWLFPMHLKMLAGMEVKQRGVQQLCFFTTALISFSENGFPAHLPAWYAPLPVGEKEAQVVLRALTATAKAVVCKISLTGIQECQEAMGGVGYMDEPDEPEFNVSRLYRDAAANVIWEGTTNVLASETVRNLVNGGNLWIFVAWIRRAIGGVEDEALREGLSEAWAVLLGRLDGGKESLEILLGEGREVMFSLAWVVCGMLLARDAQRDSNAEAIEVARRWILDGEGGVGEFVLRDVVGAGGNQLRLNRPEERAKWDCRLVWDVELPENGAAGYRSAAKTSLKAAKL